MVRTNHPERFLGRLPNDPSKPRLKLKMEKGTLPSPPAAADWYSGLPANWGVACNDKLGCCVTPETLILTESLEWVPAGSLSVGDRLIGFDETTQVSPGSGRYKGRWFRKAVVESADIVTRPCYELEFEDGTVVRSSSGHQWLTRSTVQGQLNCQVWERTEDLRAEAPRQTRVSKPLETWSTDYSWDAGYLAAAFDGEGHLEQRGGSNRIAFSQTANAMLDQFELSLKEKGFTATHELNDRHKVLRIDGTPRKDLHCLRVGNRQEFLRLMGSIRPRRLLAAYDVGAIGRLPKDAVALVRKTFLGEMPVVMLDTSSRTYFANGLASHNCTISDAVHQNMQTQWYGQAKKISISDAEVIKAYSAVSGYKPGDSSTDNGAVIQDVLNYWRTTGVGGYKIEAFAQLDASNLDLVRLCVSIFGAVDIGFDFPSSAMDQFDSGKVWTPVAHARSEGGHCVPIVGYDATTFTCVTWGKTQKMDLVFWAKYVAPENDVWVAIDTDWLRKVGTSPAGLDVATLNADYLSITGSAGSGPFAGVTPAPAPPPAPAPTTDAVADRALAAAMRAWLTERKL